MSAHIDRISSSMCPKPHVVFTRVSSSGPNFVSKFRLCAQFELQLPLNNFVCKSFGISASRRGGGGGGAKPGPTFPGQCTCMLHSVKSETKHTLTNGAAVTHLRLATNHRTLALTHISRCTGPQRELSRKTGIMGCGAAVFQTRDDSTGASKTAVAALDATSSTRSSRLSTLCVALLIKLFTSRS